MAESKFDHLQSQNLPAISCLWLRGKATVEDGWITLDRDHTEIYNLYEATELVFDFANLPCPLDTDAAIAFAARYGLLDRHVESLDHQEKLSIWEKRSGLFKNLLKCYVGIQKALSGDARQVNKLQEQVQQLPHINMALAHSGVAHTDNPIVIANAYISHHLNEGMLPVRLRTFPATKLFEPWSKSSAAMSQTIAGMFQFTVTTQNLMGVGYYQIINMIQKSWLVEECPQCDRFFRIKHKHSRYCSSRCSRIVRLRRYVDAHQGPAKGRAKATAEGN